MGTNLWETALHYIIPGKVTSFKNNNSFKFWMRCLGDFSKTIFCLILYSPVQNNLKIDEKYNVLQRIMFTFLKR